MPIVKGRQIKFLVRSCDRCEHHSSMQRPGELIAVTEDMAVEPWVCRACRADDGRWTRWSTGVPIEQTCTFCRDVFPCTRERAEEVARVTYGGMEYVGWFCGPCASTVVEDYRAPVTAPRLVTTPTVVDVPKRKRKRKRKAERVAEGAKRETLAMVRALIAG